MSKRPKDKQHLDETDAKGDKKHKFVRNVEHVDGNWSGWVGLPILSRYRMGRMKSVAIGHFRKKAVYRSMDAGKGVSKGAGNSLQFLASYDSSSDEEGSEEEEEIDTDTGKDKNSFAKQTPSASDLDIHVEKEPHISLVKPFFLRSHQIESFASRLSQEVHDIFHTHIHGKPGQGKTKKDPALEVSSKWYTLVNETRNREFLCLPVCEVLSNRGFLDLLVGAVDTCMSAFQKETYYPVEERRYHVSIASYLPPSVDKREGEEEENKRVGTPINNVNPSESGVGVEGSFARIQANDALGGEHSHDGKGRGNVKGGEWVMSDSDSDLEDRDDNDNNNNNNEDEDETSGFERKSGKLSLQNGENGEKEVKGENVLFMCDMPYLEFRAGNRTYHLSFQDVYDKDKHKRGTFRLP